MKLAENVLSVGAVDYERAMFDEVIPLPDGTSYNSYLVIGSDKTALIDTVDPTMTDALLDNLTDIPRIDYVIANHAEQDHSGSIFAVLNLYPNAKVVCTDKCKSMLMEMLHILPEKFIVVNTKDTISLGGKTLEFIHAPWVHWPETMFTYLKEEKILFSCDFLGSHFATDEVFSSNDDKMYRAAKRYYAEIMMPFRSFIKMHLEKLSTMEINMVAPSHGPVYNKPAWIIDAYKDWISDETKNELILAYVSMHGSTEKIADRLKEKIESVGIIVNLYNLSDMDIGELAISLVDARTIIVGSPAFLNGAHPALVNTVYLANALRPKTKYLGVFGSFGWGSTMVEQIKGMVPNIKAELIGTCLVKGLPKNLEQIDNFASQIIKKHNGS